MTSANPKVAWLDYLYSQRPPDLPSKQSDIVTELLVDLDRMIAEADRKRCAALGQGDQGNVDFYAGKTMGLVEARELLRDR